jgi:hypothetical protein
MRRPDGLESLHTSASPASLSRASVCRRFADKAGFVHVYSRIVFSGPSRFRTALNPCSRRLKLN